MLGPARFTHIETCAREVCRAFRLKDEIEESVATLISLDDILGSLRLELAEMSKTTESDKAPKQKPQNYNNLLDSQDLARAKRLITARENAVKSVKSSIQKAKEQSLTVTTS
jgi:hypothetical protein